MHDWRKIEEVVSVKAKQTVPYMDVHILKKSSKISSCLRLTYWRSGTDYRVAYLYTRYLTAKRIIPESLAGWTD